MPHNYGVDVSCINLNAASASHFTYHEFSEQKNHTLWDMIIMLCETVGWKGA